MAPAGLVVGRRVVPDDDDTAFVVNLRQVARGDVDTAGGKAANLGELIRAGFPVPDGFVVTTVAYERFVVDNALHEAISHAIGTGDGDAARAAFAAAPIPGAVELQILAGYERLSQGAVAVRSSATAEDLPEAAFAGQQDTFLNVVGRDALLQAVKRCWASLWSDRAIAYRARIGLEEETAKIAVAVQCLVPAEAAGVLFTANPITGVRDEMAVEASPGLGEAVVSGRVTPDRFVLRHRRWGWRIVERRPGRREVVIRPLPAGGTEVVGGAASGSGASVPDRAVLRLARMAAAIEAHFGTPQDIEWAWAKGECWILQARPMTALPDPLPPPSRLTRMGAGMVTELLPARPYPLETTTWGLQHLSSALLGPMFRSVGIAPRFERLFLEEDGVVVRFTGGIPIRPTPAILLAPLRLRRLARSYDPAGWRDDPLLGETKARAGALEARDPHALSWSGLLATADEALALTRLVGELRRRYLVPRLPAVGALRLYLELLGAGDAFSVLLFTGVETRTLETNRALEALADRIRSDHALRQTFAQHAPDELWAALEAHPSGQSFLDDLRAFLSEYGHREVGGTLQLSQPTWKDAPHVVLGMLQGLASAQPQRRSGPPPWEAARDDVLEHPLLRLPPLRSAFLALLAEARWFPGIREDTRFYGTLMVPVLRRTLLELGSRLHATGVLAQPEDVFHLRLDELRAIDGAWPPSARAAAALRVLVTRRQARRAALERTPLVDPRFLESGRGSEYDVLLHGVPGSPGVAEGPVRVIRDGSAFGALRSGDVLVAPFTNPAWTPLFERASAIVVDSGGPASHAAIVAREYGIPAVMAAADATARLVVGQRVRVDGSSGRVHALHGDVSRNPASAAGSS